MWVTGYVCPFVLKWVGCLYSVRTKVGWICPYSVRTKVGRMSVFIMTPNVMLAEVRYKAMKVDAAINLVAVIKVVGTKAEGLHVSRLAQ